MTDRSTQRDTGSRRTGSTHPVVERQEDQVVRRSGGFIVRANAVFAALSAALVSLLATPVCRAEAPETSADPGYWLPADFSTQGHQIDHLFNIILYLTGVVGVAVFVLLIIFLVQFRYRPGRQAKFLHGNTSMEVAWTLVPTLILALIAAYSQTTWSAMKSTAAMPAEGEAVKVKVYGRQFQWFFHYPGPDGKFGRTAPLWRKNTGEPEREIGLMRGDLRDLMNAARLEQAKADPYESQLLEPDPAAKDDIVVGKMVVPVNKPVVCEMTSLDVIHSFFLPNFRVKQDLVPGLRTKAWFQATRTSAQYVGTSPLGDPTLGYAKPFEIVCAELCGQGHFKMRGLLYVVTPDQYAAWQKAEAEFLGIGGGDEGY